MTLEVRRVCVTSDDAGQRIDNFLMRHMKGVPKSRVYSALRRGEVRVSGRRVRPTYRVSAGDEVRIPPLRMAAPRPQPALAQVGGESSLASRLRAAVLYDQGDVLVLDKPAGVPVHRGSGHEGGIIEALRAALAPRRVELVHRLDRDTSGCLLLATSRAALRELHRQLRAGLMTKRYVALVRGAWPGGPHEVVTPMRDKTAATVFRALRVGEDATVVEAMPATGRTHQIRIHAAEAGHPVGGDRRYGDVAFNRRLAQQGVTRLCLHAESVTFHAPAEGALVRVESPWPREIDRAPRIG